MFYDDGIWRKIFCTFHLRSRFHQIADIHHDNMIGRHLPIHTNKVTFFIIYSFNLTMLVRNNRTLQGVNNDPPICRLPLTEHKLKPVIWLDKKSISWRNILYTVTYLFTYINQIYIEIQFLKAHKFEWNKIKKSRNEMNASSRWCKWKFINFHIAISYDLRPSSWITFISHLYWSVGKLPCLTLHVIPVTRFLS